ncbi:MAG TPA: protein kinase [Vicinamibacterales bacterium]|nr:protein kinase [Vicinamibacterales bacterium]
MADLSRWPHADDILDQALARPAAERRAFIREAAGDDEALSAALEAVLAEAETDDGFLAPGGAIAGPLAGELAGGPAGETTPRLTEGSRFGAYTVHSVLGRGGMGEVYRARDTRLGRDIALKVLPRRFAADPIRHARFDREARLLASLNHPHIASIYDIEEHEGTVALVLELVEGPTLADRIADGPVPVAHVLDLSDEMAEAIAVAHARGVVHRDLKPANIKLSATGDVKILDFGIAKALWQDAGDLARPVEPGSSLTREHGGGVVGTPSYVSPEHARGQAVDHRSDIWAFGCVVYELLTGVRAFDGDSTTEVIARVLEREPDFTRLPPDTPPSLRRLIERALRKEPGRRLGLMADARLDIEDARVELRRAADAVEPGRRASSRWLWLAVPVAAVAAAAGYQWPRPARPEPAPVFLAVPIADSDHLVAGELPGIAISPDGRTLVYRTRRDGVIQLVRQSLDTGRTELVPESVDGAAPFFSPDSLWLGFTAGNHLLKVPVAGGAVVTVGAAPGGARGTWLPGDTIAYSTGAGRNILRVPAAGGDPAEVTRIDAAAGHLSYDSPAALPDGRHALVTIVMADRQQVGVLDLTTGGVVPLVEGRQPQFVATGHLIFVRGSALWAAPFDATTRELRAEPVSMIEGLELGTLNRTVHVSAAADGTLVYMPQRTGLGLRTPVWVDLDGTEAVVPVDGRVYTRASLSPDQTRLALAVADPENRDIWIYELARGAMTRLTTDPATDTAPIWSPDSRMIAFRSEREGGGVFIAPADGSGETRRLTSSDGPERPAHTPYAFTPDGTAVLFTELRSYTDQGIGLATLGDEPTVRMLIDGPYAETRPALSSDGNWLAYQSDETGRFEVYVRPFPDVDTSRTRISVNGGSSPRWGPDGRAIVFHDGTAMIEVLVSPGQPFGVGESRRLFEASRYSERLGPLYDLSPDGRRFLFLREGGPDGETGRRSDLRLIQRWTAVVSDRFGER